ncbi:MULTISPECIES: large-conductance mechanosensitive channel protein MscL [Syntrophotalea]|jgi:large conductance mechanosensitive channel|uniref:Large-conductance mechanosensitive channel n=1 Tax=Syntrophotalea acetylenica TaxID=29542 RepID=A0A1L3GGX4_SYNAC|nr:large-conductance mechanosensitive channel protein MscL [Syntrophotalea acetylenica]APG25105.1 large-conductance mechanosensitive channel [Syntrophotalea acetylenica]APG43174.1 large-conductance mechanosensitive channel [Syntrophotalea acetylenica]MDY0260898.1 large-conductance mechanosensitive channel protein MscL [Syntrophotalea acetylenica]
MGMMQEFKTFAVKGNMVDMAVGIIIGGAFGKIVSSLVAEVIMPPLGLLLGGMDFKDFSFTLKDATDAAPAVTLNYGLFLQALFDFVIIAFAIFMLVKAINALRKKEEAKPAEPPAPSKEETLLGEIRDLLKQQK